MVERSEGVQLLQRQHQGLVRGRVQEVEVDQVVDAERLEHEHHVAEVDPLDLGDGVVLQLVGVSPGGVQTEAFPGGHTTGTTCPLVGRSLAHKK